MQTKLSRQIVYNYIKNFCYDPLYNVAEVQFDVEDLSNAPFQFKSNLYYTVGAYVVVGDTLYLTISNGQGPWSAASIANTFTGEAYSNEEYTADVITGEYDPDRFKPVDTSTIDTIDVYEVVNASTEDVVIAFDNYAHAVSYIRNYLSETAYDIRVVQSGNKYTAYWNDKSMEFYEPG